MKLKGFLSEYCLTAAAIVLTAASCDLFNGTSETDTQAPTIPHGLSANAVSSSQIDLAWDASSDNVGVAGYRVYRQGVEIGTTGTTDYSDSGLAPETTYGYKVKAYDEAGNASDYSQTASATTEAQALVCPHLPDTNATVDPGNPGYRIVSPNGGEIFSVGEQCTVKVTSETDGNAVVELVFGLNVFTLPDFPMAVNPRADSVFTFEMPDTFYEEISATETLATSPVGDSVLVRIHDYAGSDAYVDYSDCYFSVRQR